MDKYLINHLRLKNMQYNQDSNEELYVIYKKSEKVCEDILISHNGKNNSAEVLSLDYIINELIEKQIKNYLLCHNHPRQTPILSLNDYCVTQKIYILSSIFDINLENHYLLCGQNGVNASINSLNDTIACVDNGNIKYKTNFFNDFKTQGFINEIKIKYKLIIENIKDKSNDNKRDCIFNFIENCYYEMIKYEKMNNVELVNISENTVGKYIKTGILTEFFPNNLQKYDDQLKITNFNKILPKKNKYLEVCIGSQENNTKIDLKEKSKSIINSLIKEESTRNKISKSKGKENGNENDGR